MKNVGGRPSVLLWHPTLYPFAHALARAVWHQGFRPEIWTFLSKGRYGFYEGYHATDDVVVRGFDDDNAPRRLARLRAALRDGDFDAAFVKDPEWTESLLVARHMLSAGVPTIVGLSENRILYNRNNPVVFALSRLKKRYMRRVIDRAVVVLCETELSVGYARTLGCATERIEVRPHPIDTAAFHPATDGEREACRREFGVAGDEALSVLYVGGFFDHKGIGYVADWARRANDENAPIEFVVPAFGDRLEEMRPEFEASGRVRLIPKVIHDAMPRLQRACDAFIIPSVTTPGEEERSPNALLEAMASGLACAGHAIGGIPSYADAGGLTVPEGNTDEFWEILRRWAGDPEDRRLWQARARQTAERRNDPERYARYLADIFRGRAPLDTAPRALAAHATDGLTGRRTGGRRHHVRPPPAPDRSGTERCCRNRCPMLSPCRTASRRRLFHPGAA